MGIIIPPKKIDLLLVNLFIDRPSLMELILPLRLQGETDPYRLNSVAGAGHINKHGRHYRHYREGIPLSQDISIRHRREFPFTQTTAS